MTPEQQARTHIDAALRKAGWQILKLADPAARMDEHLTAAICEYPTRSGPADYALFVRGKFLGAIEAKKSSVGALNVLGQAKRYSKTAADGVGDWNDYKVPFLYASNGSEIFHWDARSPLSLSRRLAAFHTPEALWESFTKPTPAPCEWFHPAIESRYYQKEAIGAIEKTIRSGRREMLLAMATGTGKTRTAINLIYRLLKSGAARRVLFLVDRRALAAQAVRDFNAFDTLSGLKFSKEYEVFSQQFRQSDMDDEGEGKFDFTKMDNAYLSKPDATKTFVYVCTIQRMAINLHGTSAVFGGDEADDESDASRIEMPIHGFDIIIADECHRGYTSNEEGIWRSVLNHFDAVKVGLTATPAKHTAAYFHPPIYWYTYPQAVLDGFLVDYEAIKINSEVRINGVFLREGERVGLIDRATGRERLEDLEAERGFEAAAIERKITAPDSNQKIIAELARHALAFEAEKGRFPKILIFAVNDIPHTSHADEVMTICRQVFGRGDDFVQKITGSASVDRPLQKIREFRNRPEPKIVVTVDMLSTGVDIPEIEYIVFLRPVKSRILWTQMLGRGTRLCPDICKDKFTIFDCFDGTLIEYFAGATDDTDDHIQRSSLPLEEVVRRIEDNQDRDYHTRALIKRLRRVEQGMGSEARQKFADFIPNGDMKAFADGLTDALDQRFAETMRLLKNERFLHLLVHYPRPSAQFIKAYETVDTVSSDTVFEAGATYLKPADYLTKFAEYIRSQRDHIAALRIVLDKPTDWNTAALTELRQTLAHTDFPERELRRAHHIVFQKDLVDIISMVKHAARAEEPVLTATERVDRALAHLTAGSTRTTEQAEWLALIRQHLIENLSIEADDLDTQPIFERNGGAGKFKKLFGADFRAFLGQINEAMAA